MFELLNNPPVFGLSLYTDGLANRPVVGALLFVKRPVVFENRLVDELAKRPLPFPALLELLNIFENRLLDAGFYCCLIYFLSPLTVWPYYWSFLTATILNDNAKQILSGFGLFSLLDSWVLLFGGCLRLLFLKSLLVDLIWCRSFRAHVKSTIKNIWQY